MRFWYGATPSYDFKMAIIASRLEPLMASVVFFIRSGEFIFQLNLTARVPSLTSDWVAEVIKNVNPLPSTP